MPRTARLLATLLIAASASIVHADDRGTLLIIGGGMTREMAPIVYGRLADLLPPGGVVGVLPTGGEGAPSAATQPGSDRSTTQPATQPTGRFEANLKGHPTTLIPITQNDAAKANDAALARQIEGCAAIFFNGGAQSRVPKVFLPDGQESAISRAVQAVLDHNGVVAGTSAGAEIMSDPMILMGESADALAGKPVPIGKGMGYFKFGLVDQHFLQRGRFGRLVVALEQVNQRFGFGISEARALLVDRASGRINVIGNDGCVFIDRRTAQGRHGIRVSLLSDGDIIDGNSGSIAVANARPAKPQTNRSGSVPDVTAPWAKLAVGKLIHDLATSDKSSGTLLDMSATLRLTVDEQTKVYVDPIDPNVLSVVNLRLDVDPR